VKVAVQDTATLRTLRPLEVAAYLRAKGWREEADLSGKASLWLLQHPEGGTFDVTLPLRRSLADYTLRMEELLTTLANAEQRSQLEVLRDILTTTSDLIRVRAPSREAEDGTLPLEQAVTFVERSRDMLLAAACAAIDKRAFFAKRKPQQAMEYLGHVRMGQTEQGSFILTILSAVSPELRPSQAELLPIDPPEPYERQVTRTLMEAVAAAEGAAQRAAINGNMEPFNEAIILGVSANLCEALVGLSDASPGQGLDIQVSWSRTRPLAAHIANRVQFDSDSIAIIAEAARHFRETAPVEDFEVEGFVTRLNRGPTAVEGDVTVSAPVDGKMRSIVVGLGPDAYSEAVRAHDDRRTIRCVGELAKEGRGYRLVNPRHFIVVEMDDGRAGLTGPKGP
jgi:hypothetical protein